MKVIVMLVLLLSVNVACSHLPPGHDSNGPGNSENAPGHNKNGSKHGNKHGGGPGNSENAPGQLKKQGY